MQSIKTIGTHDSVFHVDELVACYLLKLLNEYKDAKIIRTRDSNILNKLDIVVDVGGIYDADNLRFDHHISNFNVTFDQNHTLTILSSAGLIWKHFGIRILTEVFDVDEESCEELLVIIYKLLIEYIDAIDNGYTPKFPEKPNYKESMFGMYDKISIIMNHLSYPASLNEYENAFYKAFVVINDCFGLMLKFYVKNYRKIFEAFDNAYNERTKVNDDVYITELREFSFLANSFNIYVNNKDVYAIISRFPTTNKLILCSVPPKSAKQKLQPELFKKTYNSREEILQAIRTQVS